MDCEYVQQYYGVPACIGRRVIAYGKPGIIAEDRGNYIGVNLDSDKPGVVNNYHPTDGIVYGEMGTVREFKMTRSQRTYQEFLNADCGYSFAEYIAVTTECEIDYSKGLYRYTNGKRYQFDWICGDWKKTKKEAKASYKEALRAARKECAV